jgi:Holliday junction resolvase-like predicted endonuclease
MAVAFLGRRGVRVVDTNVFVDRDEIDIIYRGNEGLAAVEVKTVTGGADPFEALTDEKMRRLRRAIAGYEEPIAALDAIGVAIGAVGAEIRWLRGIG